MTCRSLQVLSPGESCCVVDVAAAGAERGRLESLGIVPGAEISVLSHGHGTLLLAIGASRVAVEHAMADFVYVA